MFALFVYFLCQYFGPWNPLFTPHLNWFDRVRATTQALRDKQIQPLYFTRSFSRAEFFGHFLIEKCDKLTI